MFFISRIYKLFWTPVWCPVLWRATATATTTAEKNLAMSKAGIPTHPGIKYAVRQSPHSDFALNSYIIRYYIISYA